MATVFLVRHGKEAGPGSTTPVGQYSPVGDSPFGCADMAGNVWEWCQSLLQAYPYRVDDGREDLEAAGPRVLRGGSLGDSEGGVRCGCCASYYPNGRGRGYRFRVCVAARQD